MIKSISPIQKMESKTLCTIYFFGLNVNEKKMMALQIMDWIHRFAFGKLEGAFAIFFKQVTPH